MSDGSRAESSQDPLEKYRQALRRQQTAEIGGALAPGEPSSAEAPPPAAPEPASPSAAEAPLVLEDELTIEELLEPSDPVALETAPPAPSEVAGDAAGDPLELADPLTAEDPIGPEDPLTLEAVPPADSEVSQDAAEADDALPNELQDTLARYQKAMSKLRANRTGAADPLAAPQADPGGSVESPGTGISGGDDLLSRYRQAVDRQQSGRDDPAGTPAAAVQATTVSRETLNHVRIRREGSSDAPGAEDFASDDFASDELASDDFVAEDLAAEDLAAGFPTRVRAVAKVRRRARPSPAGAPGWSIRAMTFGALLIAAPPVQWLVYTHLGASFALEDLGAGLSALLPAALILLLARPLSGKGRLAMVFGSAAVALIGSAGFAYGLSLLQNQLPQGASLVFGLLLTLGLFTAVWGPLFLILVPILSRTSLPARSGT